MRYSPPTSLRVSGSALVITLLVLALVSIMAISFSDIVRSELSVSAPHEERSEAEFFARMGVDIASDSILSAARKPQSHWVSQPGAVTVNNDEETSSEKRKTIPLHSGAPTSYTPGAAPIWSSPAELNMASFFTKEPLLARDATTGEAVPMPLRWVYVRKDGAFDLSETPSTTDAANPLIGRFAYWSDDEATRVNLNTAWKRPIAGASVVNPFPPIHPSGVSLNALPGIDETKADEIRQSITPAGDYSDDPEELRFLNSPKEINRLDERHDTTTFSAALKENLFEVTTRSASPDRNIFDEPKIVLTTQAAYAPRNAAGEILLDSDGIPYFLDILNDDAAEPHISNVSFKKLGKIMRKLIAQLKRDDWPFLSTPMSFHRKYFNNDVATAQLALNIIEYVRCAESTQPIVEPIRGRYQVSGTEIEFTHNSVHADSIRGTTRKLYVTELGASRKITRETEPPNLGRFRVRVMYELHLPEHFGVESVNLLNIDGKRLYFHIPDIMHLQTPGRLANEAGELIQTGRLVRLDADGIDGDSILKAGEYVKVGFTFFLNDFPAPTSFGARVGIVAVADPGNNRYITDPGSPRIEVAPVWDHHFFFSIKIVDEDDPTFATFQVSDPILNGIRNNWIMGVGVPHSWGKANTIASNDPTTTTRQDVDADGNPTNIGIRMPPPKGSPGNPDGLVRSVAELGFIHTGIQANASTASNPVRSVRFRTLRLRPEGNPDELPDWALLELFAAPLPATAHAKGVLNPGGNSTAGRVNINSRIAPFGLDASERAPNTDEITRLGALKAALHNATKDASGARLTPQEVETLAGNIARREVATGGAVYGSGSSYSLAGEIAEIRGIADAGEESEFLIRSIMDQLTTRSNVYTIYTIGQALKQTPSGGVTVSAEQRLKVGVELYHVGDVLQLRQNSLEQIAP